MPNLTLKGFAIGETVNVYPAAKVAPYVAQRQSPPGAVALLATAVAADGSVTVDLPTRIEALAWGQTSQRVVHAMHATTRS